MTVLIAVRHGTVTVTAIATTPHYTDNGDGTVTDNDTGLIWQKGDSGPYMWYEASGTYDASWNEDSYSVCDSLAGDWRLPTKDELFGLADEDYWGPALNPAFEGGSFRYWSSKTLGNAFSYYVDFHDGRVNYDVNTYPSYVRCVR